MIAVADRRLEDARIGAVYSLQRELTAADVDAFAAVTGDVSPLHMDAAFARARGFDNRVVHGMLLGSLLSQLVGVQFPGRRCLLQEMQISFLAPALVGERVEASIEIRFISEATRTIELRGLIRAADGRNLTRAKIRVGFLDGGQAGGDD
jgi:acyl dehydratase